MVRRGLIQPDRFRERLEAAGFSQSALARRIGITQASIARLALGTSAGSKYLHKIARELGTTPEYLTGEIDDPTAGALPAPTPEQIAEQLGAVLVPELALGCFTGGGSVFSEFQQMGVVPFQKDWLRSRTGGSFSDLFVARGEGDSMEPTLRDGDIILIDTSLKEINRQDAIWALSYGELGMIKRVRKLPTGSYQINSDNRSVSPIEAYDGEMHVIGRVIWIGRWV